MIGTEVAARQAAGVRSRARWRRERLPFLGSLVVVVLAWELVAQRMDSLIFPPFSEVVVAFVTMVGEGAFFSELFVSLVTFVGGMAIAVALGFLVGGAMALWRPVERALDVYVNAALGAPVIAFVPVFIVLFGIGYPTRILTVVIFSVFIIIVNTFAGLRSVDPSFVEMGRSFGATGRQLFWQVRVPAASGLIGTGLRIGTIRGLKGLVNGEVLVAVVGLGRLVVRSGNAFTMDRLYAVVFFLVLLTFLATGAVRLLTRVVLKA